MKSRQNKQIGFGEWYKSKNTDKYIKDVLKSRRLTYGKYCEKLEKLFCEKNGVKYSVFCSSGTGALFAAIGVLRNLNPDLAAKRKYIVLPATDFIAGHNVVVMNGFEPLYIDIAPNYNLSYTQLEQVLASRGHEIFAVMPVSLMGRPVDGLRIRDLIDKHAKGAFFVLDTCENFSSRYDGQYPESFADFSCWSTYLSHLLISGAAGGFIGTNNPKLAIMARSFVNHGRSPEYISIDDDNNVDEHTRRDITTKRFSFVQNGLNFRLGELEAAIALAMLEDDFEGQLKIRKDNAEKLISGLKEKNLPIILPTFSEKEEARHMMLPVRVASGTKWGLVHHLEANGVETRDILPMYHKVTEPYFGTMLNFRTNFPMSFEVYDKGFYIGCHQYIKDDDIEHIINVFVSYFSK